jgi:sulfite exporter TauE/SafE
LTLWLAALAGLLGSGHCVGMCGGLVSSCFLRLGASSRRPATHIAYHAARISVYVVVGALAGGLGEVLTQSGRFGFLQGVLQILTGLAVIVMGLDVLGLLPFSVATGFAPVAWTRALLRKALSLDSAAAILEADPGTPTDATPVRPRESVPWRGALLAGLANGLMPCSLTLSIAVQAIPAHSARDGALLMAAFGAGTLPSMVAVGLLFARLTQTARALLLKAAALLIIIMGVAQISQGLRFTRVMGKLVL